MKSVLDILMILEIYKIINGFQMILSPAYFNQLRYSTDMHCENYVQNEMC